MIERHISQIIHTSIIGIVANVLLASFKAVVGILAFGFGRIEYFSAIYICQLTNEIQSYESGLQVVIVVDHNYSE